MGKSDKRKQSGKGRRREKRDKEDGRELMCCCCGGSRDQKPLDHVKSLFGHPTVSVTG